MLGLELEAWRGVGTDDRAGAPQSLGAESGWVRGSWPIAFTADGPSGVCQMNAARWITQRQPDQSTQPASQIVWHQCPAGSFSQLFDTASVSSEAGSSADDVGAATRPTTTRPDESLSDTVTKPVNIDNVPVSLSLSGPTDAPSTAGSQAISATAQAGPSGVRGTWCSVDDAPYQLHPGARAQIQVSGIGAHTANCFAENNALDVNGRPARSAVETWRMTIREPSVSTVSLRSGRERASLRRRSVSACGSRRGGSR